MSSLYDGLTPEREDGIRKKWRAASRKRIRKDRKDDLAAWVAADPKRVEIIEALLRRATGSP